MSDLDDTRVFFDCPVIVVTPVSVRFEIGEPCGKTRRNGLLDDLCLWVHPVLAGVGPTSDMIWGEDVHARLELENVKTLGSGIVTLTYRR